MNKRKYSNWFGKACIQLFSDIWEQIIIIQKETAQKGDFPTININNLVNASPNRGVEFLTKLHIL
jgi:hypothetical protein